MDTFYAHARYGTELESRAVGAYLGLAVGDALGATVEFMTPGEIRAAFGVHREVVGGGWLSLAPGKVTDDTTMSLALGRAILQTGAVDARAVAFAFDDWMSGKPVDIGNTVRRGILNFRRTGEIEVPPDEHDAGNGACMRTLPVALATLGLDESEAGEAALRQAWVTHHNPLSDAATICVVSMVRAALKGADRDELLHGPVRALIDAEPLFNFRRRRRDNPSGFIVETMDVVFQSFFDTDGFEDCLVEAVNRGGDADTTGAIAGMIAGACYGVEGIPPRWLSALDGYVAGQCAEQAVELLDVAPWVRRESNSPDTTGVR